MSCKSVDWDGWQSGTMMLSRIQIQTLVVAVNGHSGGAPLQKRATENGNLAAHESTKQIPQKKDIQ